MKHGELGFVMPAIQIATTRGEDLEMFLVRASILSVQFDTVDSKMAVNDNDLGVIASARILPNLSC